MRRAYDERLQEMLQSLEAIRRDGWPDLSWQAPGGGRALWLDPGCDSGIFAERAERRGVLVQAERDYRLKTKPGTHLRLGFSGQTLLQNRKGLELLFASGARGAGGE